MLRKHVHLLTTRSPRILCALFALGAAGCGAGKAGERSPTAARVATVNASTPGTSTTITTSTIPPGQHLRGDGDADNPGDIDGNGDIDPEDEDSDYPVPNSYRLPDRDDARIFAYGRRPSAADARAVAGVVERYYADVSAGDGRGACALLTSSLAGAASSDYGQIVGSSHRPAQTCEAFLSTLARHAPEQLAEPNALVDVRVEGARAQVVLSSRKMRAGNISLIRQGGAGKLQQLLAQTLQ
jgi:hypothetical protein